LEQAAKIVYLDIEYNPDTRQIRDIGAVDDSDRQLHSPSLERLREFAATADFVCGHNIILHDLKYVGSSLPPDVPAIDTLPFSPLLFPRQPYHKLVKDDKLIPEEPGNPVNDALKARTLFHDELVAWQSLPEAMQSTFAALLARQAPFAGFFKYLGLSDISAPDVALIRRTFRDQICANAMLEAAIRRRPIELAYALALISCRDYASITPPWVEISYPLVGPVLRSLTCLPCRDGCDYCRQYLDPRRALERFFGFPDFRTYAGEPLQRNAAEAAVRGRSLLAVFPTGGGKSVTFQVPALMAGELERGLTVVISPLQSLMKDQVDNLEARGITKAVAISGLLNPIERSKAIEQVENGTAQLLYIAPESLRSGTIERILQKRNVVRVVVDEAHCFSSWGQDFRPDYLYIGKFINRLQSLKMSVRPIPVSCFTATAKQRVIDDIRQYFRETLKLEMEIFVARSRRENLHYVVFERADDAEKYATLRDLILRHDCPTIVYCSRTLRTEELAGRLTEDGVEARAFHGRLERDIKTANQDAFLSGRVNVMVATTAFGMGVDKKDVGLVIHYDISDSIENYVQEAGRAGRDDNIEAQCYVLFNDDDLNKHFMLLNQTRINLSEIQQIWRAVKRLTRTSRLAQASALEIARDAGWEQAPGIDLETRVLTSLNALEQSGYLTRGLNSPRIYANSILCQSMTQASEIIENSTRFASPQQRTMASRIMASLFSARSHKNAQSEVAESRVDYLSDILGIVRDDVLRVIQILREEEILADQTDLTAHLGPEKTQNRALRILDEHIAIEQKLLLEFSQEPDFFNLKELNGKFEEAGCEGCDVRKIQNLLNYWQIKQIAQHVRRGTNMIEVRLMLGRDKLATVVEKRNQTARTIATYLFRKVSTEEKKTTQTAEFSIMELVRLFREESELFHEPRSSSEVEDALFYLSRIGSIRIEGGFMVIYNRLNICRLEENMRVHYKKEDYQPLEDFYRNRMQQIHVVGEYARIVQEDYQQALHFVDDYFQLGFEDFLNKYFTRERQQELQRNITPAKYRQFFDQLSPAQRAVIDDDKSPAIVVAAGPGSGKTRLLVHKLAALLLMEDIKHDQLLMLTFSRAAATEFKLRLLELVGNAAHFVEIKTFHSYCFDLLGRVGSLEKTDEIVAEAIEGILSGSVEQSRITKAVLVIDEAQDMSHTEFELVRLLARRNLGLRIIAVGDDDQNIYAFRGSDSRHFASLLKMEKARRYELVTNYRACPNLVAFSNQFAARIRNRIKRIPISAHKTANGTIRIIRCKAPAMVEPLVERLCSEILPGSTAVLSYANDTAAQIDGLLRFRGRYSRLVQSNDGFSLRAIDEVRYFRRQIADFQKVPREKWEKAREQLLETYPADSKGLTLCRTIVDTFWKTNNRSLYLSDFDTFLRESSLEDFEIGENQEAVSVSTMHKAKGREFDNVFLTVDRAPRSDEDLRLYYVALTRARQHLTIFTTTDIFDDIVAEDLIRENDERDWQAPSAITRFLTHRDIALSFFERPQIRERLLALHSGTSLGIRDYGCTNKQGQLVLRFSRSFREELQKEQERGYLPVKARVNYALWWKNSETDIESKILLPEIEFRHT